MGYFRTMSYSGTGAALAVLAALTLLSRREGHTAAQPLNATTHVLVGDRKARRRRADLRHTVPGLFINTGAAFFWSALFAYLLPGRPARMAPAVTARALLTMLVAAVVDYGLMPRRLRPGWELVLSPSSVAASLLAMAAGLAGGALVADAADSPRVSKEK